MRGAGHAGVSQQLLPFVGASREEGAAEEAAERRRVLVAHLARAEAMRRARAAGDGHAELGDFVGDAEHGEGAPLVGEVRRRYEVERPRVGAAVAAVEGVEELLHVVVVARGRGVSADGIGGERRRASR